MPDMPNSDEWRRCLMPTPVRDVVLVSASGQIISRGTLRSQSQDRHGYRTVTVWAGGRPYELYVHHLVLWTWVGPRPQGLIGAHLDSNLGNNAHDNLIWTTQKENVHHRRGNGTWGIKLDEHAARAILTSTESTVDLAEKYGITPSTVSKIRLGRRWAWL